MVERYLEMKDGHRLFLRTWNDVDKPVGTLHINHGMAEQSLRYDDFARYMNEQGFIVYAQDHRGHGLTKEEEEKGWFSHENGWDAVVKDSIHVDQTIMNEWEGLPHFIMGHSMGSFITRTELTRVSDYFSAAVIMGSGASQGLLGKIGKAIAQSHVKKYGSKMPDHTMTKLSFGNYNKHFKNARTENDWLTRDMEEVKSATIDVLRLLIELPLQNREEGVENAGRYLMKLKALSASHPAYRLPFANAEELYDFLLNEGQGIDPRSPGGKL